MIFDVPQATVPQWHQFMEPTLRVLESVPEMRSREVADRAGLWPALLFARPGRSGVEVHQERLFADDLRVE